MYRNRSNGELKGDGLIVFGRDAAEEYRVKNNDNSIDLVESVCTQVRMFFYLYVSSILCKCDFNLILKQLDEWCRATRRDNY